MRRARPQMYTPVSKLVRMTNVIPAPSAPMNVGRGTAAAIGGARDAGVGGDGARLVAVSGIGMRQPGPSHADMVSVLFSLHVSR